jgi:hypothetical protein
MEELHMFGFQRRRLLLVVLGYSISLPAFAAPARPTISAFPGTRVRWTVPDTMYCGMKGRSWRALHGTCYYPLDLLQKPAVITIARWGSGPREYAHILVEPFDYGTEDIELPDIPQAHPSPAHLSLPMDGVNQLLDRFPLHNSAVGPRGNPCAPRSSRLN